MREIKFRAWDKKEKRWCYCHFHPIFTQELGENLGVVEGENEFKAQIYINEMGVCLGAEYGLDPLFSYDGFHEESLEVIGNIYENPEILK